MKLTFRLVLILVLMFGLSACQEKSSIDKTTLSTSELAESAYQTYSRYIRAINAGEEVAKPEIPERYWDEPIRELKPIKVYTHRINIVVVQKIRDGVEEGKYIYISDSSYLPMDGIDGFTYNPNPKKGNYYYLGDGIFDYRRTIEN